MNYFTVDDLLELMDGYEGQSIVCSTDGLYIKGCFYSWPKPGLNKHNVRQYYDKIYVDGYMFTPVGWKRTLRSIYENLK